MLKKIIKEWDEKFDEEFQDLRCVHPELMGFAIDRRNSLKSFIHSRDKAILEGVKEIIKKMKMPVEYLNSNYGVKADTAAQHYGYNLCITDIINLINKELE